MSAMKTTRWIMPRPKRSAGFAISLSLLLLSSAACLPKIPNVRPFASRTANLYEANGEETQAILGQYDTSIELADAVLALPDPRLGEAEREVVEGIKERLENGRNDFRDFSGAFDAILQQAVTYSERLAELAAAGETGGEAVESLAGTINEFGELSGVGAVITDPIQTILTRIAQTATLMQARGSLREAVSAAQGAVDDIATALRQIHDDHLQDLVSSLGSDHDELLLWEVGSSIVGYYREANARRNMFYRAAQLNLQRDTAGISGFCRDPDTDEVDPACIDVRQLEALGEIEERLDALRPEIEAYEGRRAELRAWRNARRANGERIVKAVRAWAKTHGKVVVALEDGTGVSAFSLQAILAEIQSFR